VNFVRAGLAAVIAIAFIGLVFFLAAFLTMAALVAAGVAALGASAWWLYRKVRGRRPRGNLPDVWWRAAVPMAGPSTATRRRLLSA
jgi:O-antigen/teichoic acid export membrane protein